MLYVLMFLYGYHGDKKIRGDKHALISPRITTKQSAHLPERDLSLLFVKPLVKAICLIHLYRECLSYIVIFHLGKMKKRERTCIPSSR